jgi:hypothetical protein
MQRGAPAGLEAALIDNAPILVTLRWTAATVAPTPPTSLALPHCWWPSWTNSVNDNPHKTKDAPDVYRLLVATRTEKLAHRLWQLQDDPLAGSATHQALTYLADLFAAGPDAVGAMMAGRAEQGIGDPITVATSAAVLASDLLLTLQSS